MKRWTDYWFPRAPLFDLAMVRIIVVGSQLSLLLLWESYSLQMIREFAELPDDLWNPITLMRIMILPFGWDFRPPFETLSLIYYGTVLLGFLALIGLRTNLSLILFTLGNSFIITHAYSFGDYHHTEAPIILGLGLLSLSPCGRVLSVDALWRMRSQPGDGAGLMTRWVTAESNFAAWPLKTVQWLFVLIYLSAVFSKLYFPGGLDWPNGYTLQYWLIKDGILKDIPLALWLAQHHYLVMFSQYLVLLFQATFVFAIILPRLRWIYVPAGLAFHVANIVLLYAVFFEWIAMYAVFIPWQRAFQLLTRTVRSAGRGGAAAAEATSGAGASRMTAGATPDLPG